MVSEVTLIVPLPLSVPINVSVQLPLLPVAETALELLVKFNVIVEHDVFSELPC